MKEHSWSVEVIEGGPEGGGEFYRCTDCGASGGSTLSMRALSRGSGDFTRKPSPFFPGPAIDVSEDCDVAHEQISYYTRGFLGYLRQRGSFDHKQLTLLILADKYTPKERARVEFYSLVFDCRTRRNMSVDDVKRRLTVLGFRFEPRSCTQCGEPNERYADDPVERCFGCEYKSQGPTVFF